jgi:hypothetical protein
MPVIYQGSEGVYIYIYIYIYFKQINYLNNLHVVEYYGKTNIKF